MKKLIVFFLVFWFPVFSLSARLIDIYKKGEIKLIPDPGFGKNTDWGLYLNRSDTITVAHDGSIFVLDFRNCIVSKFDEKGTFLLKFGQEGEGPGDLFMPLSISTLDEKYLVIGDYPLHRKISLFDLQGKFIKVIKPQYPVYKCVALRDDKIALLSKRVFSTRNFTLVASIKDVNTLEEKIVAEVTDRIRIIREPGFVAPMQDLLNHGIIRRMPDGNLLVGFVYNNVVEIYNPGGKKVKTIDLKIDKVKVTGRIIYQYKENYINTAKRLDWGMEKDFIKRLRASRALKKMFSEYLPLFSNIFVDGEGNILVFYFTNYKFEEFPKFRVYSPEGKYICDTTLNFMNYDTPFIEIRFRGFVFHGNSLFLVLATSEDDEVVKVVLK